MTFGNIKMRGSPRPYPKAMLSLAFVAVSVAGTVAQEVSDRASTKSIARVVEQTYPISAAGIDGLRLAMQEAVLPIGQNRNAVASTAIEMIPEVTYDEAEGFCGVSGVTVDVRATVTLPEWREYQYGSAEERAAWDRYVGALRAHEDLHVAIGEEFAGNLSEVIAGLPTTTNCDALRVDVARERQRVLDRHNTAQLALDEGVRRGQTPAAIR